MIAIWKKTDPVWRTIALTIPAPLVMLILFSKYAVWWGGNSHYGPRYQIETYPFLMLYIAAILPKIRKNYFSLAIYMLLLLYSIVVQWIGAFCYPGGWTVHPIDLANDKARFWDWKYNQIWTCLKKRSALALALRSYNALFAISRSKIRHRLDFYDIYCLM